MLAKVEDYKKKFKDSIKKSLEAIGAVAVFAGLSYKNFKDINDLLPLISIFGASTFISPIRNGIKVIKAKSAIKKLVETHYIDARSDPLIKEFNKLNLDKETLSLYTRYQDLLGERDEKNKSD
jgi:hypothetical protein